MANEPTPNPVVLLIESDTALACAIEVAFAKAHHDLVVAESARAGLAALDALDGATPDVIVVDAQLSDRSGIDVCRDVRARSSVPLVLICADDSELDIIVGLEVGADAIITDPTRLRELVARVRAVLRTTKPTPVATCAPGDRGPAAVSTAGRARSRSTSNGSSIRLVRDGQVVTVGDVSLDRVRHEVTVRGAVVPLPLKQFQLLDLLLENAGLVVPRDVLIREIWGIDYYGDTKTLDAHATRLRTAIEVDPRHPTRVLTVRGVGYRFDPVEAVPAAQHPEAARLSLVSA